MVASDLEARHLSTVKALQEKPFFKEVLTELERTIPKHLTYHSFDHTLDVLSEAVLFALYDNVPIKQVELIAVAALFHDAGYLQGPENHEQVSAALAEEKMKQAGVFSSDDIHLVKSMILDTALVDNEGQTLRTPSTELSQYLLDADLSNYGRDDFFEKLELVAKEANKTTKEIAEKSLAIGEGLEWFSNAGKALRNAKKEENLKKLRAFIRA